MTRISTTGLRILAGSLFCFAATFAAEAQDAQVAPIEAAPIEVKPATPVAAAAAAQAVKKVDKAAAKLTAPKAELKKAEAAKVAPKAAAAPGQAVKKVVAASPCKGLDQKACGGIKACSWIVPKDANDKTGKVQEPYCRKTAGVALKKPAVANPAAASAPGIRKVQSAEKPLPPVLPESAGTSPSAGAKAVAPKVVATKNKVLNAATATTKDVVEKPAAAAAKAVTGTPAAPAP